MLGASGIGEVIEESRHGGARALKDLRQHFLILRRLQVLQLGDRPGELSRSHIHERLGYVSQFISARRPQAASDAKLKRRVDVVALAFKGLDAGGLEFCGAAPGPADSNPTESATQGRRLRPRPRARTPSGA